MQTASITNTVDSSRMTPAQAVIASMNATSLPKKLEVELWIESKGADALVLEAIWSHGQRGVGRASSVLRVLCGTADAYGVSIHAYVHPLHYCDYKKYLSADSARLHALDDAAPDACHLVAWYGKFGFTRKWGSDSQNPDIVRLSEAPAILRAV